MQTFQDISAQAFAEAKTILKTLSEVNSPQDFIEEKKSLKRLMKIYHFLKELENYTKENEEEDTTFEINEVILEENATISEQQEEEEIEFTLTEIEKEEENTREEIKSEGHLIETETKIIKNEEETEEPETLLPKIEELPTEIEEKEIVSEEISEENQEKIEEDNKLKLPNIKALHSTGSLFEEANSPVQGEFFADTHPKTPKNFKLDLNDRIAFTAKLFNGSQVELNETINILNSFETLDKAKEYLSDVYYQKNWENVDEYAQRLWSLVENKFL